MMNNWIPFLRVAYPQSGLTLIEFDTSTFTPEDFEVLSYNFEGLIRYISENATKAKYFLQGPLVAFINSFIPQSRVYEFAELYFREKFKKPDLSENVPVDGSSPHVLNSNIPTMPIPSPGIPLPTPGIPVPAPGIAPGMPSPGLPSPIIPSPGMPSPGLPNPMTLPNTMPIPNMPPMPTGSYYPLPLMNPYPSHFPMPYSMPPPVPSNQKLGSVETRKYQQKFCQPPTKTYDKSKPVEKEEIYEISGVIFYRYNNGKTQVLLKEKVDNEKTILSHVYGKKASGFEDMDSISTISRVFLNEVSHSQLFNVSLIEILLRDPRRSESIFFDDDKAYLYLCKTTKEFDSVLEQYAKQRSSIEENSENYASFGWHPVDVLLSTQENGQSKSKFLLEDTLLSYMKFPNVVNNLKGPGKSINDKPQKYSSKDSKDTQNKDQSMRNHKEHRRRDSQKENQGKENRSKDSRDNRKMKENQVAKNSNHTQDVNQSNHNDQKNQKGQKKRQKNKKKQKNANKSNSPKKQNHVNQGDKSNKGSPKKQKSTNNNKVEMNGNQSTTTSNNDRKQEIEAQSD